MGCVVGQVCDLECLQMAERPCQRLRLNVSIWNRAEVQKSKRARSVANYTLIGFPRMLVGCPGHEVWSRLRLHRFESAQRS